MSAALRCAFLAAACSAVGCAPAPVVWRSPEPAQWAALRQRLDGERASRPARPWAAGVRVTMREPRSGRVVDGRGAIAVAPGRAVRMILVGGAGSTMLDAWVTRERWRVTVPPIDLSRRGGEGEAPDLPVGFLRWWFLSPLEGTLVAASGPPPAESLWLLRAPGAVVELRAGPCAQGERLVATRRVGSRAERVEECRAPGGPRPGDTADYRDVSTGLHVQVLVESVSEAGPEAAAFDDPDGPGGGS
jgi:hypothetical protein